MPLTSTLAWRDYFRQFLRRRKWTRVRWAEELNRPLVHGNRYLQLNEYSLSHWLNSHKGRKVYQGPKSRDDYIGLAHAMLQLDVINQQEAFQWLLAQGLYPLPDEATIFGQRPTAKTL